MQRSAISRIVRVVRQAPARRSMASNATQSQAPREPVANTRRAALVLGLTCTVLGGTAYIASTLSRKKREEARAALANASASAGAKEQQPHATPDASFKAPIEDLPAGDIRQSLLGQTYYLLIHGDWCHYCVLYYPHYEKLAHDIDAYKKSHPEASHWHVYHLEHASRRKGAQAAAAASAAAAAAPSQQHVQPPPPHAHTPSGAPHASTPTEVLDYYGVRTFPTLIVGNAKGEWRIVQRGEWPAEVAIDNLVRADRGDFEFDAARTYVPPGSKPKVDHNNK